MTPGNTPQPAVQERYRSMRTDQLLTLRRAFEADQATVWSDDGGGEGGRREGGKDFCRGRLQLIADILRERREAEYLNE